MKAEISFDLKMEENMSFVEGAYRLAGGDWHVFVFSRYAISEPEINVNSKWESGATGVKVRFPKFEKLNKSVVVRILSGSLSVSEWEETQGPDSMSLR